MIGKGRGHGPFDTYSFVILYRCPIQKLKGPSSILVFTKTTLKWPIDCCDDGAAMAHNHFLFPDHWLVGTFFGGEIFILCLFFLVNIQKQHTCTKRIIDILTFRIRRKGGIIFNINFCYGSLNRGTLIRFS